MKTLASFQDVYNQYIDEAYDDNRSPAVDEYKKERKRFNAFLYALGIQPCSFKLPLKEDDSYSIKNMLYSRFKFNDDGRDFLLNYAYKMKLDAMNHQGARSDLTCSQVGNKLEGRKSSEIMAEEMGTSKNQIFRFIRLTELIPELLDMVDNGQIKFNPAVELSYLAREEQQDFLSAMDFAQAAPSLSQAQRIKKLAQEGECTLDAMCEIMNEVKKGELDRVTFKTDSLRKYFPKSYTSKQMEDKIIQLLEQWQKKREKSMER